MLSPAQILERLSQRLDLLSGGRDAEARQLTLRATIEWSHELLTETERRLFADLAVFAGGCTLEAAEAVASADLDTLQSLVEKSLVRHTGERFWMLETIRELALERLEETAHGDELRQRLAEWMLRLAHEAEPHLVAADQAEWLERIDAERDNVRAVLDRALDTGDPHLALELAAALCRFWWVRAPSEGLAWIERGLSAGEVPPAVTAAALDAAGGCAWFLGDAHRALHLFEQGLAIYRELGDRQGIGVMLNRLGPPLAALGREDESGRVVAEAASIHRHLGNKQELALSLEILGTRAFEEGDAQKAIELLEESAALARESGDLPHAQLRGGQPRRSRARRRRPAGSKPVRDRAPRACERDRRQRLADLQLRCTGDRRVAVRRRAAGRHALGCSRNVSMSSSARRCGETSVISTRSCWAIEARGSAKDSGRARSFHWSEPSSSASRRRLTALWRLLGPPRLDRPARARGRAQARLRRGRSRTSRSPRSTTAPSGGRACAPVRERQGLRASPADQPVRHRAPHVSRLRCASLDEVGARLGDVLEMQPPQGLVEKVKGLAKLKSIADSMPKSVRSGRSQEVVLTGDDVDLGLLPIQTCWPEKH